METQSNTLGTMVIDPAANQYLRTTYQTHGRSRLLDWFRLQDRRVLDVGCGAGGYAAELRTRGVEMHGITLSASERDQVFSIMKRVTLANVETWEPDYPAHSFDAILLSHVLEHLVDPARALQRLSSLLKRDGRVYVALPNIAHWRYRLRGLRGRFDYEEMGPMDRRHLRFFTYESAQRLVKEAGFGLLRAEVSGHFPLGPVRKFLPRFAKWMDGVVLSWFPNLFGYEIYLEAALGN